MVLAQDHDNPIAEQVPLNAKTLVYSSKKKLSRSKINEHAITGPCPFLFHNHFRKAEKTLQIIRRHGIVYIYITINHPFVI